MLLQQIHKKFLPRRRSANTTGGNLLGFWWSMYNPIYWVIQKFCWECQCDTSCGSFGRKIRWKKIILRQAQIVVKITPRWGQVELNFQTQHIIPKTCLSSSVLPQNSKNVNRFDVRHLEVPTIAFQKYQNIEDSISKTSKSPPHPAPPRHSVTTPLPCAACHRTRRGVRGRRHLTRYDTMWASLPRCECHLTRCGLDEAWRSFFLPETQQEERILGDWNWQLCVKKSNRCRNFGLIELQCVRGISLSQSTAYRDRRWAVLVDFFLEIVLTYTLWYRMVDVTWAPFDVHLIHVSFQLLFQTIFSGTIHRSNRQYFHKIMHNLKPKMHMQSACLNSIFIGR